MLADELFTRISRNCCVASLVTYANSHFCYMDVMEDSSILVDAMQMVLFVFHVFVFLTGSSGEEMCC